jgi:hypothetical protein
MRENKNKDERRINLQDCALKYCTVKKYIHFSKEFPFYIASLVFPKDTEEIVKHMMKDVNNQVNDLFKKVMKIINLLKGVIKSYSENRLKKIMMIPEIKILFSDLLDEMDQGRVVLSGLVQSDNLLDQKYIWCIIESFKRLVDIKSCFNDKIRVMETPDLNAFMTNSMAKVA